MENSVPVVAEGKRGCGYREAGVYMVSASCTVGMGVGVDAAAAGLILLQPPAPVDPDTVVKRGFTYVDGEDVVRASRAEAVEPMAAPRINREVAEARAFSCRYFGIDYPDRVREGICAGAFSVDKVLDRVSSIAWRRQEGFIREAITAMELVQVLRAAYGDVELLPFIIGAQQLYEAGLSAVSGYGLRDAPGALAACWRLLDAARRRVGDADPVLGNGALEVAQRVTGYLIPATGAAADAPYSLRYVPPFHRVAPDVLDWVGSKSYPTAQAFIQEARRMGISRRVSSNGIPKGVVCPWSRSFLAHAKVNLPDGTVGPAVFGWYQVGQMQYVMPRDTVQAPNWVTAYGAQPVKVRRVEPLGLE